MAFFLRYVQHDDRHGQLANLQFYGPFPDAAAAEAAIPALDREHGARSHWSEEDYTPLVAYEGDYGAAWVNDADEPLEFWAVVDSLPLFSVGV